MKKVEIVLGSIAFTGLLIRLVPYPGGGALMVLSLSTLAHMYMCFNFALFNQIRLRDIFKKASYQGIDPLRIVGAVATGFVLSIVVVGIMFRLMLWPGASVQIGAGLSLLAIIILIGLIKYRETKSSYYLILFKRIAIYTCIGIPFLLLSKLNVTELYYRNHPAYIEAFKKAEANPNSQELARKVTEERNKIGN